MNSEKQIAQLFESLLPEPLVRKQCLQLLVNYINYANQLNPEIWVTTMKMKSIGYTSNQKPLITYRNSHRLITLNVGQMPVYGIYRSGVYDIHRSPQDKIELTSAIRLVLDEDILTPSDIEKLKDTEIYTGVYDFEIKPKMRDTVVEPARLSEILPIIEKVYRASIQKAATKPTGNGYYARTVYFQDYSAEIIYYLQQELNQEIPEPGYVIAGEESSQSNLETE